MGDEEEMDGGGSRQETGDEEAEQDTGGEELETATLADFQDGGKHADVDLGLNTTLPADTRPSTYPNLFGSGWGTPLRNGVHQNRIGSSADDQTRFNNFKLYCRAKHDMTWDGKPAEDKDSISLGGGAHGLRYQCVEYAGRYHGTVFNANGADFGGMGLYEGEARRPNFGQWNTTGNNTVYRPAHGDAVYHEGGDNGHVAILDAPDLNGATWESYSADTESYSVSVYQQNVLPARIDYTLTREYEGGLTGSGRWTLTKTGDSGEVSPDGEEGGGDPAWLGWVGVGNTGDRWAASVEPAEDEDSNAAQGDGGQSDRQSEPPTGDGNAGQVGMGGNASSNAMQQSQEGDEDEVPFDRDANAWLLAIYQRVGVNAGTVESWFSDVETDDINAWIQTRRETVVIPESATPRSFIQQSADVEEGQSPMVGADHFIQGDGSQQDKPLDWNDYQGAIPPSVSTADEGVDSTFNFDPQNSARLYTAFIAHRDRLLRLDFGQEVTARDVVAAIELSEDETATAQLNSILLAANEHAIVMTLNPLGANRPDPEGQSGLRYGQDEIEGGGIDTFCNIFAYDFAQAMGGYLPRIWWHDFAITRIQDRGYNVIESDLFKSRYPDLESADEGQEIGALIDGDGWARNTAYQVTADQMYQWMGEWGSLFGWSEIGPDALTEAQNQANSGALVVVLGLNPDGPGHVSVVLAEGGEYRARRADPDDPESEVLAPLTAQAGGENFNFSPDSETGYADDMDAWADLDYNIFVLGSGNLASPLIPRRQMGS